MAGKRKPVVEWVVRNHPHKWEIQKVVDGRVTYSLYEPTKHRAELRLEKAQNGDETP